MQSTEIVVLCFVALLADLLTLIPFAGDIIAPIFWVLFSGYLFARGFGFINVWRLIPEAVSFVAELIPGVQEVPTIIIGTVIIIVLLRMEDRTGLKLTKTGSLKNLSPSNLKTMTSETRGILAVTGNNPDENINSTSKGKKLSNAPRFGPSSRVSERQQTNAERFRNAKVIDARVIESSEGGSTPSSSGPNSSGQSGSGPSISSGQSSKK